MSDTIREFRLETTVRIKSLEALDDRDPLGLTPQKQNPKKIYKAYCNNFKCTKNYNAHIEIETTAKDDKCINCGNFVYWRGVDPTREEPRIHHKRRVARSKDRF